MHERQNYFINEVCCKCIGKKKYVLKLHGLLSVNFTLWKFNVIFGCIIIKINVSFLPASVQSDGFIRETNIAKFGVKVLCAISAVIFKFVYKPIHY